VSAPEDTEGKTGFRAKTPLNSFKAENKPSDLPEKKQLFF